MRLRFLASLALAALLAACSSTPPAADTTAQPAAPDTPEATEAYQEARDVDCRAAGGTLQPLGRLQRVQCVIPYADAGKSCTDGSQCAGDCVTETAHQDGAQVAGQCQADDRPFGCFAKVEDGRATGGICID